MHLPNLISGCRLVASPVLLCLGWYGYSTFFLVVTAAAFTSDILDGALARRDATRAAHRTVDRQASLQRNIAQEILAPAGSLFHEVPLLLHEELKGAVDVFRHVLAAIAAGAHTRQAIAAATQGTLAATQHYLYDLQAIGVVEHRLPLTRLQEPRRQGTYHMSDPFVRFWHRWVAPHRRLLEINQHQIETLTAIRTQFPCIVAPVWELLARQHVLRASGTGRLPFVV